MSGVQEATRMPARLFPYAFLPLIGAVCISASAGQHLPYYRGTYDNHEKLLILSLFGTRPIFPVYLRYISSSKHFSKISIKRFIISLKPFFPISKLLKLIPNENTAKHAFIYAAQLFYNLVYPQHYSSEKYLYT